MMTDFEYNFRYLMDWANTKGYGVLWSMNLCGTNEAAKAEDFAAGSYCRMDVMIGENTICIDIYSGNVEAGEHICLSEFETVEIAPDLYEQQMDEIVCSDDPLQIVEKAEEMYRV